MAPRTRFTEDQINWMKARDARGVPRLEIAREFTATFGLPVSLGRLRQIVGTRAQRSGSSRPTERVRITVELSPTQAQTVRSLAAELGYVSSFGPRAGEGHVEGLLRAIAAGDVRIARDEKAA